MKFEQKDESLSKNAFQDKIENNLLKIQHNILLCEFLSNKNTMAFLGKMDDLVKEMESKKSVIREKDEKNKKVS